jgi:hypothetical protein
MSPGGLNFFAFMGHDDQGNLARFCRFFRLVLNDRRDRDLVFAEDSSDFRKHTWFICD